MTAIGKAKAPLQEIKPNVSCFNAFPMSLKLNARNILLNFIQKFVKLVNGCNP
jgi:hypothetical protein